MAIGVLKRVRTHLKGVLKECHSIFNSGVGGGVPLKFLAMSGSAEPVLSFNVVIVLEFRNVASEA